MKRNFFSHIFGRISDFIDREPIFIRSIFAGSLLEDFFVSAVAAVLAIRLYLMATGYGQLTFGQFHIAHIVWGGLFMLIAIVIVLGTLNRRAEAVSTVVGGIGFGAFIDELGKFITKENDYFFQPAIALIYIIFIAIFLVIHTIRRRRPLSPQQSLANVFSIAGEGSLTGLDKEQKQVARELLENCQPGPVKDHLTGIIESLPPPRVSYWRLLDEVHEVLDRIYDKASHQWWFGGLIMVFFAFTAVTSLAAVVVVVEWTVGLGLWVGAGLLLMVGLVLSQRSKMKYLNIFLAAGITGAAILISLAVVGNLKQNTLVSIVDYARLIFPGISGVLIILGLIMTARSRLHGYLLFRLSILVSIFFTQVLSFYEQQLFAMLGLLLNVIILVGLRYLIMHEKGKLEERTSSV